MKNGYSHKKQSEKSKSLLKQLTMFLIASIGTNSLLFNSGGNITTLQPDKNYHPLPEFKIDLRSQDLQTVNKDRRILKLQNIVEDENDPDWSFVPKAILFHKKIVVPKHVEIGIDKEGKQILSVKRNSNLRVKVLWKDGTISWVAGDALRLQNPFLFIPYVKK